VCERRCDLSMLWPGRRTWAEIGAIAILDGRHAPEHSASRRNGVACNTDRGPKRVDPTFPEGPRLGAKRIGGVKGRARPHIVGMDLCQ